MGSPRDIAITQAALLSSLGHSLPQAVSRVRTGAHGLTREHRFATWCPAPVGAMDWRACQAPLVDLYDTDTLLHFACQRVCAQVLAESQLLERYSGARIGLFLGTTTCGISRFFQSIERLSPRGLSAADQEPLTPHLQPLLQQSWITQAVATRHGLKGPVHTLNSSCAASAQALGLAFDALHTGWVDAAVVVGADVLNLVTLCGFDALQVLDFGLCRPFTPERAGINLGEAAVAAVLERVPAADRSPRLLGYGAVSEAYHMTHPAPDGSSMRMCMVKALHSAQTEPGAVALISPHATGTAANDQAEGLALAALFAPSVQRLPTKGLTGHTLGASGLLELVVATQMLDQGQIGLKNAFGFGGADVSLIFTGGEL